MGETRTQDLVGMHPDPVALVALSPSLTAVLGRDGTPSYLSPSAASLFDTVHPDDGPILEAAFADAVAHPGRAVPVRFRARAGAQMRHLAGQFLNRVDDPRVGGVVLHLTDITTEATLAEISRDLMDRGAHDLDACIDDALEAIAQLSGADRASLFLVRANGLVTDLSHEWCRDPRRARHPTLAPIPLDAVPRIVDLLLEMRTTVVDLGERPDLQRDAAAIRAAETRSLVLAPVSADGVLVGCVALEMIDGGGSWPPPVLLLLDQFAPTVAAAVERRRIEREFRDAQIRFEEAWKHAPIGMVMLRTDTRVLRVNPAYCELLGFAELDLLGAPLRELVHPDDLPEFEKQIDRLEAGARDRAQLEMRFEHRLPGVSGEIWTWCRVSLSVVRDDHQDGTYLIGQVEDVTERREFEARLAYEATHDALTGLSQRNPLLGSLERALASAARRGDNVAVLFIDVDNFKRVNDTLGHAAGDELLQSFAGRLERAVRASDLAARLGGDEFVVMCTDLTDPTQVVNVARRILSVVERPFSVRGVEVFVGASIGIAVAEPGIDAATLLRQADTAAYRAKDRGKNRYEIFDDELRAAVADRIEIESLLRQAIDAGEVQLSYQPIVDVTNGSVVAFEVRPQWPDAVEAMSRGAECSVVAEESGLVVPIGRRVVHEACAQLARWQREHRSSPPGVAVNISARQFAHPSLVDDTRDALRRTGVRPATLTLEITESVLVQDADTSIARLGELRALGVRIAIDDFGSGYSSLGLLRRLPVNAIKIDPSYIVELGLDRDGATIVAAVINLARGLGLDVVASGVSSPEHAEALAALGCHLMQGAHFSGAVTADSARELIGRQDLGVLPSRSTT